jgi:hypothetical protein
MATDSLAKSSGNFQELRNMWSSKVNTQTQEKSPRPTSLPEPKQEQKKTSTVKITNEPPVIIPTMKKDLPLESSNNESKNVFLSLK